MRTENRRFVSLLLALVLAFAAVPAVTYETTGSVYAAGEDPSNVSSAAIFYEHLETGDDIRLTADITLEYDAEVKRDLDLDLNGHKLTLSGSSIVLSGRMVYLWIGDESGTTPGSIIAYPDASGDAIAIKITGNNYGLDIEDIEIKADAPSGNAYALYIAGNDTDYVYIDNTKLRARTQNGTAAGIRVYSDHYDPLDLYVEEGSVITAESTSGLAAGIWVDSWSTDSFLDIDGRSTVLAQTDTGSAYGIYNFCTDEYGAENYCDTNIQNSVIGADVKTGTGAAVYNQMGRFYERSSYFKGLITASAGNNDVSLRSGYFSVDPTTFVLDPGIIPGLEVIDTGDNAYPYQLSGIPHVARIEYGGQPYTYPSLYDAFNSDEAEALKNTTDGAVIEMIYANLDPNYDSNRYSKPNIVLDSGKYTLISYDYYTVIENITAQGSADLTIECDEVGFFGHCSAYDEGLLTIRGGIFYSDIYGSGQSDQTKGIQLYGGSYIYTSGGFPKSWLPQDGSVQAFETKSRFLKDGYSYYDVLASGVKVSTGAAFVDMPVVDAFKLLNGTTGGSIFFYQDVPLNEDITIESGTEITMYNDNEYSVYGYESYMSDTDDESRPVITLESGATIKARPATESGIYDNDPDAHDAGFVYGLSVRDVDLVINGTIDAQNPKGSSEVAAIYIRESEVYYDANVTLGSGAKLLAVAGTETADPDKVSISAIEPYAFAYGIKSCEVLKLRAEDSDICVIGDYAHGIEACPYNDYGSPYNEGHISLRNSSIRIVADFSAYGIYVDSKIDVNLDSSDILVESNDYGTGIETEYGEINLISGSRVRIKALATAYGIRSTAGRVLLSGSDVWSNASLIAHGILASYGTVTVSSDSIVVAFAAGCCGILSYYGNGTDDEGNTVFKGSMDDPAVDISESLVLVNGGYDAVGIKSYTADIDDCTVYAACNNNYDSYYGQSVEEMAEQLSEAGIQYPADANSDLSILFSKIYTKNDFKRSNLYNAVGVFCLSNVHMTDSRIMVYGNEESGKPADADICGLSLRSHTDKSYLRVANSEIIVHNASKGMACGLDDVEGRNISSVWYSDITAYSKGYSDGICCYDSYYMNVSESLVEAYGVGHVQSLWTENEPGYAAAAVYNQGAERVNLFGCLAEAGVTDGAQDPDPVYVLRNDEGGEMYVYGGEFNGNLSVSTGGVENNELIIYSGGFYDCGVTAEYLDNNILYKKDIPGIDTGMTVAATTGGVLVKAADDDAVAKVITTAGAVVFTDIKAAVDHANSIKTNDLVLLMLLKHFNVTSDLVLTNPYAVLVSAGCGFTGSGSFTLDGGSMIGLPYSYDTDMDEPVDFRIIYKSGYIDLDLRLNDNTMALLHKASDIRYTDDAYTPFFPYQITYDPSKDSGGGSQGGGGSSGGGSSSGGGASSQTNTNTDGTTTTTTNNSDGGKTETTKKTDGTQVAVTTDKNGAVTSVTATISKTAAENAAKTKEAVVLPTTAAKGTQMKVDIPDGTTVDLAIPTGGARTSTVVYIVKADGTEEIVKDCDIENGVVSVKLDSDCTLVVRDNQQKYRDVEQARWSADAIDFVTSRQIMNGNGDGTFEPFVKVSRGMMAQVLYNLDRKSAPGNAGKFTDSDALLWFEDAVGWASDEGIVTGNPNGSFGVNEDIQREQAVTMLFRYANKIGLDTTKRASLDSFPDAGNVLDYGRDAMEWAVAVGLINGNDGMIDPEGSTDREQLATMLMRFVKLMH